MVDRMLNRYQHCQSVCCGHGVNREGDGGMLCAGRQSPEGDLCSWREEEVGLWVCM